MDIVLNPGKPAVTKVVIPAEPPTVTITFTPTEVGLMYLWSGRSWMDGNADNKLFHKAGVALQLLGVDTDDSDFPKIRQDIGEVEAVRGLLRKHGVSGV